MKKIKHEIQLKYYLEAQSKGLKILDMKLYHYTRRKENITLAMFLLFAYIIMLLLGMLYGISLFL